MKVTIELTETEARRLLARLEASALIRGVYGASLPRELRGLNYLPDVPVNGFGDLISIREKLRRALDEAKYAQ